MNPYLQLMRIQHSVKNLLIFIPLLFGGGLRSPELFITALLGFFVFCGISSLVYIINDILDRDKDRLHHTKCSRPIASGRVTLRSAVLFALFLLALSLILGFISFGTNISAWMIISLYLVINLGYSFGLKQIPLLDISIIACGFLLRVLFGSVITDISISKWLFITIIVIAFYFAIYKRREEYLSEGADARPVLKKYNEGFLDKTLQLCLTLVLVFYSLWCIDGDTISRLGGENIIWTIPLVLIMCMKYLLNDEKHAQDPISVILHDKILLCLSAVYGLVMLLIIYGPL